jgi:hypothetical protein
MPAGSAIERENAPVAALAPHVVLVLLLLALRVLARDREDVVLDLDLDLLRLDPRNVSVHNDVAVGAHDVDRRRPCALIAVRKLVEHAVKPRAQLGQLGKRVPTR